MVTKKHHDEPYKDKTDKLNKRNIQPAYIKQVDNNADSDGHFNDLHHEHTERLINQFKFVMNDYDINLLDWLPHGYDNDFLIILK